MPRAAKYCLAEVNLQARGRSGGHRSNGAGKARFEEHQRINLIWQISLPGVGSPVACA
jgi:hypothetical protein